MHECVLKWWWFGCIPSVARLPELGQLVNWKVWAWDWAVGLSPWTWAIPGDVALFIRGVRVWHEELLGFFQVCGVVPLSLVFVISFLPPWAFKHHACDCLHTTHHGLHEYLRSPVMYFAERCWAPRRAMCIETLQAQKSWQDAACVRVGSERERRWCCWFDSNLFSYLVFLALLSSCIACS